VPALIWTAINPNSDGSSMQWAVSFGGAGAVGNSIANGVYDMTLNPAAVTSDANPAVNVQSRPTDTFYRLFGDINGDGVVNAADNFQFKTALATYNAAFDSNGDGVVNAADNFQLKNSQSYNFASSGIVYTI
jgi:dTDP-4-dehydrorhamnose reductase